MTRSPNEDIREAAFLMNDARNARDAVYMPFGLWRVRKPLLTVPCRILITA